MSALTGTGQLVRLAVRRDRILLPAWIATFVVMVTFSASATTEVAFLLIGEFGALFELPGW